MKHPDELREYLDLVLASPVSLTSVDDPDAAWRLHVEDALTALGVIADRGPTTLIDVGSGGGSPGVPLAVETGIPAVLLEARERKAEFLRSVVERLGIDCEVVSARSEDHARGVGRDAYDMALARALAPPPVAVELCLPLVRPGGWLVLWTAELDATTLAPVAAELGGRVAEVVAVAAGRQLVVVDKLGATPERYPRRPGMAGKRPLASLPSEA